jgi:NAD(P)-dependent dehydrogenase (short-subunit alcohol dehydrogenase family)
MKLQGQVALVTGGARGLGRATALALAREGANLVVADILEDGLAQTERELNGLGVESVGAVCDVSAESNVEDLVQRTIDKFGQIDILVNTVAWIDPPGLLVDMPLDVWDNTLLYDLTTHFLVCKHVLKQSMIPRNYGRIVNISSEAGKGGYRLRGAYCAAKAGVINLSMTLAAETADYDIKVNALCPRGIAGVRLDTLREMFADYASARGETRPASAPSATPRVDRTMQPEELAEFILFLVSPEGSRINGQAITVG